MRKTQGQWLRRLILKRRGVDIMPEANIISVMELCTSHLPGEVAEAFTSSRDGDYPSETVMGWGVIVHPMTYGWLLYIPQDDLDPWADMAECPPELLHVMRYAHAAGVAYVLFDADVSEIEELPVFDWSA